MAGLGLMNRRRAIQSSPTQFTLAMNDNLIAMYDMSGKSNDDADRAVVADLSGNGYDITFPSDAVFNDTYGFHNGYYVAGNSYNIDLSETIDGEFTIIIDREFVADVATYSALVGAVAIESSNKSVLFAEYKASNSGVYENVYRDAMLYKGRINSPIFWMTPNGYNGYINDTPIYANAWTTKKITIGRVRTGAGSSQLTKIRGIYIFNKTFSPNDIERYIQENIMPDYVLPIV